MEEEINIDYSEHFGKPELICRLNFLIAKEDDPNSPSVCRIS